MQLKSGFKMCDMIDAFHYGNFMPVICSRDLVRAVTCSFSQASIYFIHSICGDVCFICVLDTVEV